MNDTYEVGDWVMLESEEGDRVDGPVVWIDRAFGEAVGLQLQGHMLSTDPTLFKTFWLGDADNYLARWTVVGHGTRSRVRGPVEDVPARLERLAGELIALAADMRGDR